MTKYLFDNRLYLHIGTVGKLESKDGYCVADDNGFDGKIGKLIGRNYCRLIPKVSIYKTGFDLGFLVWNCIVSRHG